MVNFKEKYHFQGSGGGPYFPRGTNFFQGGGGGGGVQLLIPIETQITCDFPGGGGALVLCLFSCNFVVRFQSSPAIKSFLELTA